MTKRKNKSPSSRRIANPAQSSDHMRRIAELLAAGQYAVAEQQCRRLMISNKADAVTYSLLADVYLRTGRSMEAQTLLERATILFPDSAQLHLILAKLYFEQGAIDKASSRVGRSLELDKSIFDAHVLLGLLWRRKQHLQSAEASFIKALSIDPANVAVRLNLALTLYELGRYKEAAEQYQRVSATNPDCVDVYLGSGLCADALGDVEQAIRYFEQGLARDNSNVALWNNITTSYLAAGRTQQSLEAFQRSADLKFNGNRLLDGTQLVLMHRIRHDAEQLRYLDGMGRLPEEYRGCLTALTELEAAHAELPGTHMIKVEENSWQRIAPSFDRFIYRAECPALSGGALNPTIDWAACEARYLAASPEVVVIDGFLNSEALESLRAYCLESTVFKTVRPNGYLGALLCDGFATPLLVQIVTELRERMPEVFRGHYLEQAWAYKYDSRLKAINIHADCAIVNANFWITPDSANNDPSNGGLVFWDKIPPSGWGLMRTQNQDKTEIKEFLKSSGAKKIVVPHRQNRMVLFNSALFHKSDDMNFKEGYENRRINVTLLYGKGLR